MKLPCPLHEQARIAPEHALFVSENAKLSYYAADRAVAACAEQIADLKLAQGSRLAGIARNSIELCVLYLACLRCEVPFVPINLRSADQEIRNQLNYCSVGAVYCAVEKQDWSASLKQIRFSVDRFTELEALEGEPSAELPVWNSAGEGCVIFTSGSSGSKKGACLGVSALLAAARASNSYTGYCSKDTWLLSLPLYHVSGLGILLRTVLAGASLYIPQDGSRETILQLMHAGQVSHLSLVPSMLRELLELNRGRPFGQHIKLVLMGGAALDQRLAAKALDLGLPLINSYGLTESCGHICCTEILTAREQSLTCGYPLAHNQIAVVDDAGSELNANEIGRIKISGEALFSGYLSETGYKPLEGESLLTQDLAKIDQSGRLTVLGRADNVINSGGEKFSALELEQAACEFPGVNCAAALAAPDQHWGERPVLFVETHANSELSVEKLRLHLEHTLPNLKWPKQVFVLGEIPLNGLGKTDYLSLKRLLQP